MYSRGMERGIYATTVRDLMTQDIQYVDSNQSVEDAFEWLQRKKYTAAPLSSESSPYYFVRRPELAGKVEDGYGSESVQSHATQIDLDRLISPDVHYEELLEFFEREELYFIGWHDELEGIITRADLNKLPSHTFLYSRINQVENVLRDILNEDISDKEIIRANSRKAQDKYDRQGDADLQLRLIDYTTFGDLKDIVNAHNDLWKELPFNNEGSAVRILSDIKSLRDDVAHHGNVIQIMEIDGGSSNRDILDLRRTYDNILEVISSEN